MATAATSIAPAPMENFAALFEESLSRQEMRQGEHITAEAVRLPKRWRARRVKDSTEIAGIDRKALLNEDIELAHTLLRHQGASYMYMLAIYKPDVSDVDLLKQIGQHLHFFSNMSQLVVA